MGVIRQSITAPPGFYIWACDSAQIELRVNLWFCGQWDALNAIVEGIDSYKVAAAEIFYIPSDEVSKDQRKLGKARELGLQYRMGAARFQQWCASGPLGMDPIAIDIDFSRRVVQSYRRSKAMVASMWDQIDTLIPRMADPAFSHTVGPVTFCFEEIKGPTGSSLRYPNLHFHEEWNAWVWGDTILHKIHGGLILENIIQFLANIIIDEQILAIDDYVTTVSMTHDEILGLCRIEEVTQVKEFVTGIMSRSPEWAPDLPLGCEFEYDTFYCK